MTGLTKFLIDLDVSKHIGEYKFQNTKKIRRQARPRFRRAEMPQESFFQEVRLVKTWDERTTQLF